MTNAISLTNVTPLNVKLTPLTPEQMEALGLKLVPLAVPMGPPPAPTAQITNTDTLYAEIKVGGKTVAKLFNSGAAEMSNAAASKVSLTSDGQGPSLAQIRAEEIAKAIGGKIVKADTAQTQSQWARSYAEQMKALEAWKQNAGYGPKVQAELLLQAQEA